MNPVAPELPKNSSGLLGMSAWEGVRVGRVKLLLSCECISGRGKWRSFFCVLMMCATLVTASFGCALSPSYIV